MKNKKIKQLVILFLLMIIAVPIVSLGATSTGVSGLSVAKYKLEGAESKPWTDLKISASSRTNSQNISLKQPGTTVVTMYVEDRAGNQSFDIKAHTVSGEELVAPVKKIEYRLTGDTEKGWTEYKAAFKITNEGVTNLEARIIDEAGNITTINEKIFIDKTKPVNTEAVISLD